MRYAIERVEWKDHADAVLELMAHSFPGTPPARYAWLHEHNPAGASALWLATTPVGRVVGTAAIHPRAILVDGRVCRAGVASDFVVEIGERAFGPALALQRTVLSACDSGEFDLLYGFCNNLARPVFERVGFRVGHAHRLARVLQSRPYLQRARALGSAATLLATPVDLALRLLSRETYSGGRRGVRLERVSAFDATCDRFWAELGRRHAVIAARDSESMNWRYLTSPVRTYELRVLRRGGEVVGTVVSYRRDHVVYLAELLALDARALDDLLVAFLRTVRAGARAVSLVVLGDTSPLARLARYAFVPRRVERTMVAYAPASSPLRHALDRLDRWLLFEGDVL